MANNVKVTKHKVQNVYYGGDKVNENDEESYKLYINDCHHKQAALCPPFVFNSNSVRMLLETPGPGELLVLSGQSRLHLYLRQKHISTAEAEYDVPLTPSNEQDDVPLFQTEGLVLPGFPETIEDEARVFRSHGLPLLVWPKERNRLLLLKYLEENYPDCAHWFSELAKVSTWLKRKWRPLGIAIGLCVTKSGQENSISGKKDNPSDGVWIVNLPKDSVVANYTRQRWEEYERFNSALQAYFIQRLQFAPGFQFNAIHRELEHMSHARAANVSDDAGFFNVVGNLLLQASFEAQKCQKPLRLNPGVFTHSIKDSTIRNQCFQSLLSAKLLRNLLKKEVSKVQVSEEEPVGLHISDEEMASDNEGGALSIKNKAMENRDLANVNGDLQSYPNRPVSKDIMENRGLVKYRHKRERNPRVHLRHKFHKATVRYRSQVAPLRHEDAPYAGEVRGIRTNLVKSHKFSRR
ncbi:unnamed protein product [Calicophoron daubneyi]|uniref:Sas10 C-terminal domain-containing protein n=1 Tax=Calicophoron daubneyi TaxID=300641 RepID=A0AAV2T250_CALDB